MSGFRREDLICRVCGYEQFDHLHDLRGLETEEQKQEAMKVKCPACASQFRWKLIKFFHIITLGRVIYFPPTMVTAWNSAPRIGFGSEEKSPVQHARMKKSLRERFYKKEIDDIRHVHGTAIDDSIRAGNIQKIKRGERPS